MSLFWCIYFGFLHVFQKQFIPDIVLVRETFSKSSFYANCYVNASLLDTCRHRDSQICFKRSNIMMFLKYSVGKHSLLSQCLEKLQALPIGVEVKFIIQSKYVIIKTQTFNFFQNIIEYCIIAIFFVSVLWLHVQPTLYYLQRCNLTH